MKDSSPSVINKTPERTPSAGESLRDLARSYFPKALIAFALLGIMGISAPRWPIWLIAVSIMAYAFFSTLGSLYFTTRRRLRRQVEFNKEGTLSNINRKWTMTFTIILVLSLFSAFFFLLESPNWELAEWILTLLAVPFYFVVFRIVRHKLRNEFEARFLKARAMQLSFWITGAILCILYAAITSLFPGTEASTLRESFDAAVNPYANAHSAFMQDAGELTTLTDGLSHYAVHVATGAYPVVGFVVRFVIYASVIFGMMGLFSFCLLEKHEATSALRLLPANDERAEEQPLLKRYVGISIAAFMVILVSLNILEYEAYEVNETEEHSHLYTQANDLKSKLADEVDGVNAELKQMDQDRNIRETELSEEASSLEEQLSSAIDDYYNDCEKDLNKYMDWYNGWDIQLRNLALWFPLNDLTTEAKNKFLEIVPKEETQDEIEDLYARFKEALEELSHYEYFDSMVDDSRQDDLDPQGTFIYQLPETIDLWQPLQDSSNTTIAKYLLSGEDGIKELIEKSREHATSIISREE